MKSIRICIAMVREGVFAYTVVTSHEADGRKRFTRFDEAVDHARTLGDDSEIVYGSNHIWVPLTATPGIEKSFDEED